MSDVTAQARAEARPIRIVLVDDHPLIREGVRMLLEGQPDLELAAAAADAASAREAIAAHAPDVLLLDLDLGGDDGFELLESLGREASGLRVLVFTGIRDAEVQRRAVRLGAMGVVPKEQGVSVLLAAIRRVHAGEMWMDRKSFASVLRETRPARDPNAERIASLTPREREIVVQIARGSSTRRLAATLGITEKTIRNHMVSIYAKLGVSDRLELAIFAGRHGLGGALGPGRED